MTEIEAIRQLKARYFAPWIPRLGRDAPVMASTVATPEDAAGGVIDAILAGEPYVIMHGDLVDAIAVRSGKLTRAAEAARAT